MVKASVTFAISRWNYLAYFDNANLLQLAVACRFGALKEWTGSRPTNTASIFVT